VTELPDHAVALGGIVAVEGAYSVINSQPGDDPVASIAGEDGTVLALALEQAVALSDLADRAAIIGGRSGRSTGCSDRNALLGAAAPRPCVLDFTGRNVPVTVLVPALPLAISGLLESKGCRPTPADRSTNVGGSATGARRSQAAAVGPALLPA
jgi:hypothetical protein